ncbi:MAG: tetratricopeptide repeat protein [Muribaculaceae bacterium]|nr:tetratricopeptide repeat protein [Muribaculaceae bacterium]
MKIRYFITAALIASAASYAHSQSNIENPITKAMMGVYAQELEENPENYEIYFRRANEYYNLNQYLRALSDIDNALKYTPETETDLLFQEYTLRANIYMMSDRKEDALIDLEKACQLDPTSTTTLFLKANTEYELGKYADAKEDYSKLSRYDQHMTEPLIGLARIAVKENNLGLANEYIDRAVSFASADSEVYLRRADVRKLMGNNTGAVDDLIIAISIDKENSRALAELVAMSNSDYNAVITGLSSAIQQAPAVGMFVYLRAIISMSHYRYTAAIADFHQIIDENLYNYAGIYGSLAECYYGIGKYQEALTEINQALSMTTDNGEYYITRAKIRRAMGDYDKALESASTALDKLPGTIKAIVEKGLCEASTGNYEEASELFGEAIMDAPDNAYNYFLRAAVMTDHLNQTAAARSLYRRVADLDADALNVKSFKGFALLMQGKTADATAWMDNILANAKDVDGSLNYYGACLFSQMGNMERALSCMENSLENGYADYTNWTKTDDCVISVAKMRSDKRFEALLNRYDYLFKD